ncbi:MAG TPA: hypothetical protein VH083_23980 [Myxococcales bacterium]|jgi:hypothetical protein|nr:hypothetical protein [Myxococcales bacterium]
MPEPKRTRPAAVWGGAGALLTGAVWAVTQLTGGPAQARTLTSPVEANELKAEMHELRDSIERLNERLSRLEGRVEVRSSGIGR